MDKHPAFLYKGLVVCVIVLFVGVGINPAFAIVQNETVQTPVLNPDETRYLANFTMDFGENITNGGIEYEKVDWRSYGDWTVNVRLKFKCPENLKIIVTYYYFAELDNIAMGDIFTFCDVRETVTIVNGSNPPDIDIDYTEFINGGYGNDFNLILKFMGILDVYEFVDGEWVYLDRDYFYDEIKDYFDFNRIRPSERNKNPDDDCNLCPRVSNQQNERIVGIITHLSTIIKHIPITEEEQQEISDIIKQIQDGGLIFTCDELWKIFEYVGNKFNQYLDEGRIILGFIYWILHYPIGIWWAILCYNP